MTNKTLLIIHTIVYATFAFALFVLADVLWPLYGLEVNDQYARFLSQHNSIFLGGIAILAFVFRNVGENNPTARKLFTGLMWTNLLGVIVTLYACIKGVFGGFGWSDPAFFAVLTVICFMQIGKNAGDGGSG
jgi:uncharacterized membrane protein